MVLVALLLCSGAFSGSLVKAANASKTAVNKRAIWGAASVGSFVTETVDGKFEAGITLG